VVQLAHGGFLGHPELRDGRTWGPSEGTAPTSPLPVQALEERDLEDILDTFAASALRALRGGADGVQIHAAHGTLPMQFLSPQHNRRTDRFGGSPRTGGSSCNPWFAGFARPWAPPFRSG
jgi:2,4-dienoyl-CoA reductase-like NADH-dependent reductase (Old Yellow Enzyme family)